MPLETFTLDDGGVLLKGTGTLVFADVARINAELYRTPESIRALRYQICDYTEVDAIQLSAPEVRELARQDSEAARVHPRMPIAVVGSTDLLFGLLRMWEAYSSLHDLNSAVFRSVAEAQVWIAQTLQSPT